MHLRLGRGDHPAEPAPSRAHQDPPRTMTDLAGQPMVDRVEVVALPERFDEVAEVPPDWPEDPAAPSAELVAACLRESRVKECCQMQPLQSGTIGCPFTSTLTCAGAPSVRSILCLALNVRRSEATPVPRNETFPSVATLVQEAPI